MKLYTGKGDQGTTTLFNSKEGERIAKDDYIIESLGAIDELNSFLGVCKAKARKMDHNFEVKGEKISDIIHQLQEDLFIVQAQIAGADKDMSVEKVNWLEQKIELMTNELPPIKTFLIAGGTEFSAMLDYARTLARKAERRFISAVKNHDLKIGEFVNPYLNRLSSILYVMVRFVNEKEEVIEKPPNY